MDEQKTIADHFAGRFTTTYDGRYDTGTPEERAAYDDFVCLTNYNIAWAQVHGSMKNPAKAAAFVQYPYWRELHECCGLAVREHAKLRNMWYGNKTGAQIMDTAMKVLRMKYGLNAPKWWLAMIVQMRNTEDKSKPLDQWDLRRAFKK